MTVFCRGGTGESLSAASRRLHLSLATVSRHVSELEERLKLRLVMRRSRKLTLTEVSHTSRPAYRDGAELATDALPLSASASRMPSL